MLVTKTSRPGRSIRRIDPAVVIYQNDSNHRTHLIQKLSRYRWQPMCANGLINVREILKEQNGIRLIIADINCDDPSIVPLLSELQELNPDGHFIFTAACTNLPNITSVRRTLKKRNLHLLLKPYYFDEMWQAVRNVLENEISEVVH